MKYLTSSNKLFVAYNKTEMFLHLRGEAPKVCDRVDNGPQLKLIKAMTEPTDQYHFEKSLPDEDTSDNNIKLLIMLYKMQYYIALKGEAEEAENKLINPLDRCNWN